MYVENFLIANIIYFLFYFYIFYNPDYIKDSLIKLEVQIQFLSLFKLVSISAKIIYLQICYRPVASSVCTDKAGIFIINYTYMTLERKLPSPCSEYKFLFKWTWILFLLNKIENKNLEISELSKYCFCLIYKLNKKRNGKV